MTQHTLYLLVTCSMERSRATLSEQVVANLVDQNARYPFLEDLLVFDNASTFTGHLDLLPSSVIAVRSDRNVGYWSAVNWVLGHAGPLMGRLYDYIYIIESDLIHRDMQRLGDAERFLVEHADVGGIRTQAFSVRWRAFFDKGNRFLPFARRDAWVMLTNQVTGERVHFHLADPVARIYRCNFLAKLPALNRFAAMVRVFDRLKAVERIDETDFMRLYCELYPEYAVLDGGLYRLLSCADSGHVSGSYSSAAELAKLNYRPTRVDHIVTDGFTVSRVERQKLTEGLP